MWYNYPHMEFPDPYLYPGDDDEFEFDIDRDLVPIPLPESRGGESVGSSSKIALARRFISELRDKLEALDKLLAGESALDAQDVERLLLRPTPKTPPGHVIEGVFNGEHMIGADGKQYTVPTNYASKSKLIEGDILKLTITEDGSFIYKQIGPIERQRVIGILARDEVTGEYVVLADGKKWSVLLAAVTYYHAEPGDQLVILIPKNAPSRWAAVENVIKKLEVPAEPKRGTKAQRH